MVLHNTSIEQDQLIDDALNRRYEEPHDVIIQLVDVISELDDDLTMECLKSERLENELDAFRDSQCR